MLPSNHLAPDPLQLLQKLIRFNTTNPPGNEAECIFYIQNLLNAAGIETKVVGMDSRRPNLIARLNGRGSVPPFLMYGHVDVVSTQGQQWKYDPFEGVIADSCVWGRGALDMKGAVAMMVSAFIRIKREGFTPAGDIILCIVSDEEDNGVYGTRFLVQEYRELFKGIKYAIGEVGGFTWHVGDQKFYPIMIAEKQRCCLKTVIKGTGGHGSIPVRGGAMMKTAQIVQTLDQKRLPLHITPPVEKMIRELSGQTSFPVNYVLKFLLNPLTSSFILHLFGHKLKIFEPILRNTVNATMILGGSKINVVPSEITLKLDGRILPEFRCKDLLNELRGIFGEKVEFEIEDYDPGPLETDMGLFKILADIIKEGDQTGIPIPFVISGTTDARFFSKLGIQTYGFTPMILPEDFNFVKMIHNENERIPIKALEFGFNAIYKLILKIE